MDGNDADYTPRRLAGGCRTGSDTGGRLWHALPAGSDVAVCGATYGRRSAGWSEYRGRVITCRRCLRRMEAGHGERQ